MNPLDWSGGDFLTLYIFLAGAVLILLQVWRNRLGPRQAAADPKGLDAIQIAYLAGGPQRAMDTALVALFEAGAAVLDPRRRIAAINRDIYVAPEFQPFRHVSLGETGRQDFHAEFKMRCLRVHEALARLGLVPSEDTARRFRLAALLALSVPVGLGLCKLAVGLSRGRPVGYLSALLVLTVIAGTMLLSRRPFRSHAGTLLLRRLRQEHARAARAPLPAEMPLAFALSGSTVLAGRDYRVFLQSGDTGSSDSGSSSSDGGGDGGCGGCSA